MRKTLIFLALLLTVGMFVYAETDISGELMLGATDVFTPELSTAAIKAEINIDADIDENTSVSVELDAEKDDWNEQSVSIDDFRITTDILGAIGVEDVSLDMTLGLFDTYFCNWNYVSRSGEEYSSSTASGNYLWNQGQMQPTTDLAVAVDLGYSNYNLMYWMDIAATQMNVAFSGNPITGANFLIGYYAEFAELSAGNIWVEGGYELEAGTTTVFIPASFTYDLDDSLYGWSSGLAVDLDAYHFAAGVGGAGDTAVFADLLVELSTSIVEDADLYAIADMDFAEDTAFQSVDLGGKYNFGAFGFGAGYVFASSEEVNTSLWSGSSSMNGSGLYLLADVDF